ATPCSAVVSPLLLPSRSRSLLSFLLRRPPTSTLFPYTTLFRSGVSTPLIIFIRVDLPAPFSPISPITSPLWIFISMSCKTVLVRSEEHTSELQSRFDLVCRLLLEKKKVGFTLALPRPTAHVV